ncbi:MAG: site-specific integrase [Actinomycetota bacterium]|jgi:integrase|nr:site-specific integrase [Actinomycetota bacterium]
MAISGRLELVAPGSSAARAGDNAFESMLSGWRDQQLARNLNVVTIEARERLVRRFRLHAQAWPWEWLPGHLEAWVAELRIVEHRAHSTIRSYQLAVGGFCDYLCDPAYGWGASCLVEFGSVPSQVCRAENLATHTTEYEGRPHRRSLTRTELQDFFDAADDHVETIRSRARKGWVPAFRDATMLKVAYAWGLRRRELRMLEVADFGPNPHAQEFGAYGVCYVRWGKAAKGSPPRRRSVLTVMGWSADVLGEWAEDVWPTLETQGGGLWPSERGPVVSEDRINAAFARCASAAGLPDGLSLHCLRHSYVTHLIEDGFDALFVQQQVGHEYASTTAIYTSVSSDYKTRVLRAALDGAIDKAKRTGADR